MKPVLHDETVLSAENYGFGTLSDAMECTVSCEENGTYDLTLQYPVTGIHAEELLERRIISARPSSLRKPAAVPHLSHQPPDEWPVSGFGAPYLV